MSNEEQKHDQNNQEQENQNTEEDQVSEADVTKSTQDDGQGSQKELEVKSRSNPKSGTVENLEVKTLEGSEVEIDAEIPADEFEAFREQAVKKISEKTEVDGFRKGQVPENVLEQKFGQVAILEEMAQRAVSGKYPQVLSEQGIDAVGQPEVSITKLAKGSPLGFKIRTSVLPEIELPEYKKVAKKALEEQSNEAIEITEKEVDDVIGHIKQQRSQNAESENQNETQDDTPEGAEQESQESSDEAPSDAQQEGSQDENAQDGKQEAQEETAEMTDEGAKELGFDSVTELRGAITDNLKSEKESQAKDKKRAAVIDALAENTSIDLPKLVVENELERMMAQLQGEISNMGMEFEQYLEHVGKSEQDLREASRPDAEKRAKSQLIINKIATVEGIEPDKETLDAETKKLTDKYEDADPDRSRAYAEMVLTNQKVLEMLEGQAETNNDSEDSANDQANSKE